MHIKVFVTTLSILAPNLSYAIGRPSAEWDSQHERVALKTILDADQNFCPVNQLPQNQAQLLAQAQSESDIYPYMANKAQELPLIHNLKMSIRSAEDYEEFVNKPKAKETERRLSIAKELESATNLTQALGEVTQLATDLKPDIERSFDMARQGFIQKRLKLSLLKALPPSKSIIAKINEYKMHEEVFVRLRKLLLVAKEEKRFLSIARPQRSEAINFLLLEKQRSEILSGFSDVNPKKEIPRLRERLNKVELASPQRPYGPRDWEAGWQMYLQDTTLVGMGHRDCGLTIAEHAAIEYYTEGSYMTINESLWKGKEIFEGVFRLAQVMEAGMAKLNSFRGYVYRDAILDESSLALHSVGSVVTYKGFTSTSIRGGYSKARKVHIKILSRNGKLISPIAQLWSESEVLFKPNTQFKVINRTESADGSVSIEMEEI